MLGELEKDDAILDKEKADFNAIEDRRRELGVERKMAHIVNSRK